MAHPDHDQVIGRLVGARLRGAADRRAVSGAAAEAHPDAETWAAYVDGGLRADEVVRLETHLAGCPACRRLLAVLAPEVSSDAAPAVREVEAPAAGRGVVIPFPRRQVFAWMAAAAGRPDGRDALVRVAARRSAGLAAWRCPRPRLKRRRRSRLRQPLRRRTLHPRRARRSRGSQTPRPSIRWRAEAASGRGAQRGAAGAGQAEAGRAERCRWPCVSPPSSPQPKRSRLSRRRSGARRQRPRHPAADQHAHGCGAAARAAREPAGQPAGGQPAAECRRWRRRRRRWRNRLRRRMPPRRRAGRGQRNARACPAPAAAPASPSLRRPRPMPRRPTRASGARTSSAAVPRR